MTPTLLLVAAAADPTHLRAPLELGTDHFVSAESCRDCHPGQVADWDGSRHRAAWSNDLFRQGYIDETKPFCVYCHAPTTRQSAEVLANTAWYRSRNPRSGLAPGSVTLQPEPHAAEGITCAVCHVRGDQILATTDSGMHDVRRTPELAESRFCADCHEFPMPQWTNGVLTLTEVPMQSTFTEWQQSGVTETCQDCHMPNGRHTFRGVYDLDWLRSSVVVEQTDAALKIRSEGVGHHFPSGDLFRHLTVEAWTAGEWVVLHTIGRKFEVHWEDGAVHKRLVGDTSLRPGVPITVDLPGDVAWRVRYHYGSSHDEARVRVPLEQLVVVVASSKD